MKTTLDCLPCFARQAAEVVTMSVDDPARREALLRRLLREIAGTDWQGSPPEMAQRLHRIIRRETGIPDPYRRVKDEMNRAALDLLPRLRDHLARQPDPREAAVRLAIGGNLLDAGAKTQIGAEDLPRHLETIWPRPLRGRVDDLFRAAEQARCILYLADNAGEIVFDRVLIEVLPAERITVFVRGAPVINDATMDDAVTAGLPEVAPVLDNGSDAPGTVLADCSPAFREWFDRADLVIAKGQGNYETLSDVPKRIFFLFTVKCPVVAAHIGEPVGSLVVKERLAHE
ncbi:MAG TPA: ARMT1-like domain-containing protein [Kiritimatiellia bacterium]|nr:ARMT1-like domain-containing protein [Kiritimatiellia bacterium]HRZ10921.1 ARMT1-like domain-containing protein [Kiritimatiellia bacterium]HSA18806.1 ARMT1-like domain-containing protein [Kiritimatiellia bacterium]